MGNIHKFTDNVRTSYGAKTTSLGGETADTISSAAFVDTANYDLVVGIAHITNVASGVIITLTAYEATATGGGGSASLAAHDHFTAAATSDTDTLVCQVRGEDLSAGYQYVGFKLYAADSTSAGIGGLIQLQMRARYKQASLPA